MNYQKNKGLPRVFGRQSLAVLFDQQDLIRERVWWKSLAACDHSRLVYLQQYWYPT